MLVAQAAAATIGERTANASRTAKNSTHGDARSLSLEARLALKLKALRKHRTTIRFFKSHRRLLSADGTGKKASLVLRRALRGARTAAREVAYYRRLIRFRHLAHAAPRVVICAVFGRYCRQALAVAWCESRLTTTAQNGQYLGLFQMSWTARRIFGHGRSAHRQALAAHRYFVSSGRDWSPWGCRWAAD